MTTVKPNLFIIGAAKSGTTSLYDHLAAHPDVFLSDPKEPGFFTPEVGYYPTSEEWYLGLFEGARGERYVGEASTHYSKLPVLEGVPERIEAFVDREPRFIYLMRDPVERAISHYWHNLRMHEEHRDMRAALRANVTYVAFGDYKMQLEPYIDRFGESLVYPLTFEALVSDPEGAVGGLLRWLGLPDAPRNRDLERKNARPERIERVRGLGLLLRFAHSRVWDVLSPLAPSWVKKVGRRLSVREVVPEARPDDAVVESLREEMIPRVRELESYLDREFPEWTTLWGGEPYENAVDSAGGPAR